MKLGDFIEAFVARNSMIRLLYKNGNSGHRIVLESWDDVSMEWEVLKGRGKFRHYIDNEVLGVVSILTGGSYPESINIVIEELTAQPYIEEVEEERVVEGCCLVLDQPTRNGRIYSRETYEKLAEINDTDG